MSESILATPPASTGTPGGDPGTAGGQSTASWRDSLPQEIRGDATLSKYSDIQSLANAHISLQRMVGADKIPVPTKNSSESDWQNVFKKLGLPESVDKYEVKLPKDFKGDEKFLGAFKEQAIKAGVLPTQAEKLLEWYNGADQQAQKTIEARKSAEMQQGVDSLRKEWGEAWDRKVQAAQAAVDQFGGDELKGYLAKTGLGNDPTMIKLMNKIGEALSEGKMRGEGDGRISGLAPQEAQAKINSILSDMNHPYFNNMHADHKRAVQEVQSLFESVHGKK